jgi:hypothetical protein
MGTLDDWALKMREAQIRLIPKSAHVSLQEVPGEGLRICCDFYVTGIEKGDAVHGGYRRGHVVNVDHHAPTARMARRISSTNLAIDHVEVHGVRDDALILINHSDCDSTLSSAIVGGLLPPDPMFGVAAIKADHTGEEDPIADLLQSLDPWRDPARSLYNLDLLLSGRDIESEAAERLARRHASRKRAGEYVADGRFLCCGGLWWAEFDERVDGEFFPDQIPAAEVIMMACPFEDGRYEIKLRLGPAAPEGLWLSRLGINDWDPAFGGRWNAGSNNRGGGTDMAPRDYASHLISRLDALS